MKTLTQHILEVSSSTLRRAAKKQREVINRDEFLDGKTAREYVNALKRADAFDAYANLKDEKARIAKFKSNVNGILIYDHNGIQVVSLRNRYSGSTDIKVINDDWDTDDIYEVEFENDYQHSSLDFGAIENMAEKELDRIKDETDDNTWKVDEEDSVDDFNISYGDLVVYAKYGEEPLFTINGLELSGGRCKSGPGGSQYYSSDRYFKGSTSVDNITPNDDLDSEEMSNLLHSMKPVIGQMLADIINLPIGWEFVDDYNDNSFKKIGLHYLVDDICSCYD